MGKKNYKTTSDDKRVYPIKVRLIKPNPANQDRWFIIILNFIHIKIPLSKL